MIGGTIREQEQSLNPSPVVYLYEIDLSTAKKPAATTLYLTPYRNGEQDISFGGQVYTYADLSVDGYRIEAGGKLPDPQMTVLARPGDTLLTHAMQSDIRGATVTRIKTYARHLDSGESPDATACRRNTLFVNALRTRINTRLVFKLSAAYGLEGMNNSANRSLSTDNCALKYRIWNGSGFTYTPARDGGCPWGNPDMQSEYPNVSAWGGVYFDGQDQSVSDPSLDRCSKHASGCMARFSRDNILQPIPIEAAFKGSRKC